MISFIDKKISSNEKAGKKQGFSLVETVVAVVILVIVVIGPMTAAQRALISASYSRDQMKAYFLAEEAIEYVRYVRDKNSIVYGDANNDPEKDKWLKDLDNCVGLIKTCGIDPTGQPDVVVNCNNSNDQCLLYIENGIYNHKKSGVETSFRRKVNIIRLSSTEIDNDSNEIKVTVTVSWKTGNLPTKIISLSSYLSNWKEQPSTKFDI